MLEQLHKEGKGNFSENNPYWSYSEFDSQWAWEFWFRQAVYSQDNNDGWKLATMNGGKYCVRCVRVLQ